MPNDKNPDWLKEEIARLLLLVKLECSKKGEDLIDEALEYFEILMDLD